MSTLTPVDDDTHQVLTLDNGKRTISVTYRAKWQYSPAVIARSFTRLLREADALGMLAGSVDKLEVTTKRIQGPLNHE